MIVLKNETTLPIMMEECGNKKPNDKNYDETDTIIDNMKRKKEHAQISYPQL